MRKITVLCMLLALICVSGYAVVSDNQSVAETFQPKQRKVNLEWKDFEGKVMRLLMYGKRENGKAINRFFPSKENGNENEAICFRDGVLVWSKGEVMETYTYEIRGKYLHIWKAPSGENLGWFLLEGVVQNVDNGSYELFTINNVSWYRWFFVKPF